MDHNLIISKILMRNPIKLGGALLSQNSNLFILSVIHPNDIRKTTYSAVMIIIAVENNPSPCSKFIFVKAAQPHWPSVRKFLPKFRLFFLELIP